MWILAVFLCVSGCRKETPVWKLSGREETQQNEEAGLEKNRVSEDIPTQEVQKNEPGEAVQTRDTQDAEVQRNNASGEVVKTQDTKDTQKTKDTEKQKTAQIAVHVCGQVQAPGVYYLEPGVRVIDAVEAAGGFTTEADPEAINLAAFLKDAQRLYIPSRTESAKAREAGQNPYAQDAWPDPYAPGGYSPEGQPGASSGKVNINTASAAELLTLPGIGESKAQAILSDRDAHGAFAAVEDIMKVPGIKQGIFEQIQEYLVVG